LFTGCNSPIAYLAAIQIYGKQWLSLLSQHKEKAWFSSSVKSRLQYLGPQPGILVLDDEHVKGVHLDPLAGPVDAFCLLVLDPEKVRQPFISLSCCCSHVLYYHI
jgi:hypothetical protein